MTDPTTAEDSASWADDTLADAEAYYDKQEKNQQENPDAKTWEDKHPWGGPDTDTGNGGIMDIILGN